MIMYIKLMLGRTTNASLSSVQSYDHSIVIWSTYVGVSHKAVKAVPTKIKHRDVVILFSKF